jgi:hypothetical protein
MHNRQIPGKPSILSPLSRPQVTPLSSEQTELASQRKPHFSDRTNESTLKQTLQLSRDRQDTLGEVSAPNAVSNLYRQINKHSVNPRQRLEPHARAHGLQPHLHQLRLLKKAETALRHSFQQSSIKLLRTLLPYLS